MKTKHRSSFASEPELKVLAQNGFHPTSAYVDGASGVRHESQPATVRLSPQRAAFIFEADGGHEDLRLARIEKDAPYWEVNEAAAALAAWLQAARRTRERTEALRQSRAQALAPWLEAFPGQRVVMADGRPEPIQIVNGTAWVSIGLTGTPAEAARKRRILMALKDPAVLAAAEKAAGLTS